MRDEGDRGPQRVRFECCLCGHTQACRVVGLDTAPARVSALDGRGDRLRAALATSEGVRRDAWQSLALVRCPKCRRRNPCEVRTFRRRAVACMIAAAVTMGALSAALFTLAGPARTLWLYAAGAIVLPILVYCAFASAWDDSDRLVRFLPGDSTR